jgi:hypothetical protein
MARGRKKISIEVRIARLEKKLAELRLEKNGARPIITGVIPEVPTKADVPPVEEIK